MNECGSDSPMPAKKTPFVHAVRHWPSTHAPPAQVFPQAPQFEGSRCLSAHAALQVSMHAVAQVVPVQVARSSAPPAAQAEHEEPQADATPSPTQFIPQRVLPAEHVVLHAVPSHVGIEPGTPCAQRVHEAPHARTSVARAHSPLHGLKPLAQV